MRGPDLLWGGNTRAFFPPAGAFQGVIAGSPCQDFSRARRSPPTGYGVEMLLEFARVVTESQPTWWLLENVPTVPNVTVPGYTVQRLDLNALECCSAQSRLRHFQFGSIYGLVLVPNRKPFTHFSSQSQRICLATEGKRPGRRCFADFCELQGLPRDFHLPGMSVSARYAAVGNGVPLPMARTIAAAVREANVRMFDVRLCACGCGRVITGKQLSATPACRKRLERQRKCEYPRAVVIGQVTAPNPKLDLHATPDDE